MMKKNDSGFSRIKLWATPLCMLLCLTAIAAMAVDSFAKYYHSFLLPKAPIVAIFANGLTSEETIYSLADHSPTAITGENAANRVTETVLISPQAFKKQGNNHAANTSYTVQVSNTENGKTCEVALKYTLKIHCIGQTVPLGVTEILITSGDKTIGKIATTEDAYFRFVQGTVVTTTGVLPAGTSTTHTYNVVFNYVPDENTGEIERDTVDTDLMMKVIVHYEQILPE